MKISKIGMIALAATLFAGPPVLDSDWVGQAHARPGKSEKQRSGKSEKQRSGKSEKQRRGKAAKQRPGKATKQEKLISRDQAAAVARSATGGRVLGVQLRRNGSPKYRVKVLLEGKRVRNVSVDGRSGRVSK